VNNAWVEKEIKINKGFGNCYVFARVEGEGVAVSGDWNRLRTRRGVYFKKVYTSLYSEDIIVPFKVYKVDGDISADDIKISLSCFRCDIDNVPEEWAYDIVSYGKAGRE